jgi:hypothetical protein
MKKKILLTLAFLFTLLLGIGIGGAANAPAPTAAPNTPAPVTVTGPTEIVPGGTVTVTAPGRTVTVAPKAAPAPAIPDVIEDGLWEVGVDIQIGRYKVIEPVDPAAFCYWQISPVGKPDTIIDNGVVSGGRPIVTIKKGQTFETNGCGNWKKVRS